MKWQPSWLVSQSEGLEEWVKILSEIGRQEFCASIFMSTFLEGKEQHLHFSECRLTLPLGSLRYARPGRVRQLRGVRALPPTSAVKRCSTCVLAKLPQSCPTLWDPTDSRQPGSSVHGLLQTRILEWVSIPSTRGLSRPPRDRIHVSYVSLYWQAGSFPLAWETPVLCILCKSHF